MTMPDPTIAPVKINGQTYMRPVMQVAVVTVDGSSCTVPVADLLDMIGDGEEYTVRIKTMRVAEFERLPEFTGF
jgi:hypothetical protein